MPDHVMAELFGWISGVDAPDDLRQQVERRRLSRASGESRALRGRGRGAVRVGRWVAAGVGIVAVLAALGLAAHSRDDGRAGSVSQAQSSVHQAAVTYQPIPSPSHGPCFGIGACDSVGVLRLSYFLQQCHIGGSCSKPVPFEPSSALGLHDLTRSTNGCTASTCGFSTYLKEPPISHPGRWQIVPRRLQNGAQAHPISFDIKPYTFTNVRVVYVVRPGPGIAVRGKQTPVTEPQLLILKTWLELPQADMGARPWDRVLEVQTLSHLSGSQTIAATWQAIIDALTVKTANVRVIGVGIGDTPTEPKGAATYRLNTSSNTGHAPYDTPANLRSTLRRKAAAMGLRIQRLIILFTNAGPTVNLIATPLDGNVEKFAAAHHMPAAELQPNALATLVQITDQHGQVVLADGGAIHAGIGTTWIDPRLHICISRAGC